MKNYLSQTILTIIVSVVTLFVYMQFNSSKLAVVDTNVLISEYTGTKSAIKELEKKTQVWKNNLDTLTAEFQDRIKKFEKDRPAMSENELKLAQELLRNKQAQLEQYQGVVQQKIQEEDQKVSAEVFKEINDVVSKYGKEHGYEIIIGAKGDGGVLYGDKSIDITDELIKILNNEVE